MIKTAARPMSKGLGAGRNKQINEAGQKHMRRKTRQTEWDAQQWDGSVALMVVLKGLLGFKRAMTVALRQILWILHLSN